MRRNFMIMGLLLGLLSAYLPAQALKVYYNNPNEWTAVKAYVYKGADNNEWPGAAMTKEGGLWVIEVADTYAGGNVIFNNGAGQQYPEATGKELLSGNTIICQDKDDDTKTIINEYITTPFKVYFDMTGCTWAKPYVHYWGAQGSEWPGVAMTLKSGSTTVYEYSVPAGTAGVIFTDGAATGTKQTPNLVAKADQTYTLTGAQGGQQTPVGEPFYVYYDNGYTRWNPVKIHYWGGTSASAWEACPNMQLVSGNVYRYQVPAGTTGVIFRDTYGSQTVDYTAVADHIYNYNGDQGAYTGGGQQSGETAPAALYVLGTVGDTFWATTPGVAMTKNGNVFTAEGVVIKAAAVGTTNGYFQFATKTGADWDTVNGGDRYGAPAEDTPATAGTPADVVKYEAGYNASSCCSWVIPAGTYTLSVDFSTMKMTATLTGSGPVAGTGSLSIPDVTIRPGKDATMQVNIATSNKMSALQFDIELPACVTAGEPLISRTMSNHALMANKIGSKLRVVVFSETNAKFSATDGALLYLPLTAAADASIDDYTITLSNIIFSDANLLKVEAEDVTGKLTVEAVPTGSVTLDKTVLALNVGQSATLTATVLPEDAAIKTVTWSTSDAEVATVANGKVTAQKNGSAVITATCNGLTATCTVYVGKVGQTITWNQVIGNMGIGDEVTLSATASSGLDVEFVITNGTALAEIVGGKLVAKGVGVVTVEARQTGNANYAPAEPVAKNVTIWLGYTMGDVNKDEAVTLLDVTTTIDYILEKDPKPFNFGAADMDGDGTITVVDATHIVEIILSKPAAPAPKRHVYGSDPSLSNMEQYAVTKNGNKLSISFTNMENYLGTQMEISLPEGLEVESAEMSGSNHRVAFRNLGGNVTRVVVFSKTNDNFSFNGSIDLTLNTDAEGEMSIYNALVDKRDGSSITEAPAMALNANLGEVTGIRMTEADTDCSVYTLDGVCVYTGKVAGFNKANRGTYVVKTATKTTKVLVK